MKFGTDGIRGPAGTVIVPALARAVGNAVCQVLGPRICVAGDTRPSTPELRAAVVAGIVAAGGEALLLGTVPTPALSAAIGERGADGGIMVTASHNPAEDNGVKALGRDGRKLGRTQLAAIEAAMAAPVERPGGKERALGGAGLSYVRAVLGALPEGAWLRQSLIVLDAAGGAATEWAPDVLSALGAMVLPLFSPRINENCGANHPQRLAAEVRAVGASAGIALDGDGDRGVLVGAAGEIYDGDGLLWLLRQPPVVVGTIMTNAGLERALFKEGIALHRTAVGDANVDAGMRRVHAAVGGEPSGHMLFADGLPTADGLLSCLRALHPNPLSLSARAQGWTPDASIQAAVRVTASVDLGICAPQIAELEAEGARVVVRPSGTEPVIRVMVEHPQVAVARRGVERLVRILEAR